MNGFERFFRTARWLVFLAFFSFACDAPKTALLAPNLLPDPGFERESGAVAEGWEAYESGYVLDEQVAHSGARSIRCENASASDRRGAVCVLRLDQKEPSPLLVSGWSRAKNVGGASDSEYSLYVDLEYVDGTPLWGQIAPFSVGDHNWQMKRVFIDPAKPVREARIYAMFRNHSGTAWFDDFSAVSLANSSGFDSQPVAPPSLPAGAKDGWFARDAKADSPILPLLTPKGEASDGAKTLNLRLVNLKASRGGRVVSAEIRDVSGADRAVTVYYVERLSPKNATWWSDIRRKLPVPAVGERGNYVPCVGAGATGAMSLYPFACVTTPKSGHALGIPPFLGPRIARIGYDSGAGLLFVAFDLGLTGDNLANSDGRGHGSVKVAVVRYPVDAAWGFRDAARSYYRIFPEAFERRAKAEGIWMPFTDPSTVRNVQDFGIAYHEGDNSVKSDDKLGILSFRYAEPMSYWMPMPPSEARTYENALATVRRNAEGKDPELKRWAQAVLLSGTLDDRGRYNVGFENAPWANGAVWTLNPNPRIPRKSDQWTKARLNYSKEMAEAAYGSGAKGNQDGEYLDSLEGWADTLDYRPESIRYSLTPPTFSTDEHRIVLPDWFSVYEEAASMRADLHRRGKLLMANSTPVRKSAFAPLLDVMGIETNWRPGGEWKPDDDETFNLRRTLSYHKPYLLLQNTDFNQFGYAETEKYFNRCMFYGVFPSMFSADAATSPYWQTPKWYERDRPLFKRYIPIIKSLSAAGWEPVTEARSDNPNVFVERYGVNFLTLLNRSSASQRAKIFLDPILWRKTRGESSTITLVNRLTGKPIGRLKLDSDGVFTVNLKKEETLALQLSR